MNEKKDVEFRAERSQSGACVCACCHDTNYVTKIDIPETKYFNGENLATRYTQLWICDACMDRFIDILESER